MDRVGLLVGLCKPNRHRLEGLSLRIEETPKEKRHSIMVRKQIGGDRITIIAVGFLKSLPSFGAHVRDDLSGRYLAV